MDSARKTGKIRNIYNILKENIIYYIVMLYYKTVYKYYMYKLDMLRDSIQNVDSIETALFIMNRKQYNNIPKSFKYNIINYKFSNIQ